MQKKDKKTRVVKSLGKNTQIITTDPEKVRIVDTYTDMFFLKEKPISEGFLDRLFMDLVEWSKKDDSLRIKEFFAERGIANQYFYRWKEKYPKYQRMYEFAMDRIAGRREIGAITRKYDAGAIERYQPMYDAEYKAIVEWRASLSKKDEQQAGGTIIVNLPAAPVTTEVPERNKE